MTENVLKVSTTGTIGYRTCLTFFVKFVLWKYLFYSISLHFFAIVDNYDVKNTIYQNGKISENIHSEWNICFCIQISPFFFAFSFQQLWHYSILSFYIYFRFKLNTMDCNIQKYVLKWTFQRKRLHRDNTRNYELKTASSTRSFTGAIFW